MDKNNVVYIYAMEGNETMSFVATCMDLSIIILNQKRKTKTNTTWYHLYVESKIWQKWIYLLRRNRFTDIENTLVVAKRDRGIEGMNREFGVSRCKLLYIGWISKKFLL